ncbi:unnamed protein product [Protopolystoma xenopodis]|uniref:protein-tyrosine-phosphatase n=1 Tax=Protopolystoma xenopodis TaxID=117903 RepID=A0A448WJQ2_9PLAT|nr:unnamed protein product [Protopolystoma xenopodis]
MRYLIRFCEHETLIPLSSSSTSSGSGRTGIFIALSTVLERLRQESVVDMYQTVKLLRQQRVHMVQTDEQYRYCYLTTLEYLNSFDLCAHPPAPLLPSPTLPAGTMATGALATMPLALSREQPVGLGNAPSNLAFVYKDRRLAGHALRGRSGAFRLGSQSPASHHGTAVVNLANEEPIVILPGGQRRTLEAHIRQQNSTNRRPNEREYAEEADGGIDDYEADWPMS